MTADDASKASPERRKRRRRLRRAVQQRLSDSVGTVRGVIAEPRSVPSRVRDALLAIWRVRGGGFYGLGYVVAFVVLEVRAFFGNFAGDGDITSMIVQEVAGFFFRFATQSFLNGFIAFAWPVFVVEYLKGWGIVAIALGWIGFERWGKSWLAARVPALAAKDEHNAPSP